MLYLYKTSPVPGPDYFLVMMVVVTCFWIAPYNDTLSHLHIMNVRNQFYANLVVQSDFKSTEITKPEQCKEYGS